MLLQLYGYLFWRLIALDHGAHIDLHLFEVVDELVIPTVLDMAHMPSVRSPICLYSDRLELAVYEDECSFGFHRLRVFLVHEMRP